MKINPQEFYRQLFDAAGEGIILVDERAVIKMVNKRMSELFGYQDGELVGKTLDILIPSRFKNSHSKHFTNYFKSPKSRSMGSGSSLTGVKKSGHQFPVEVSLNHFISKERRYSIALITDISKRVVAEKNIIELNEKLEQTIKKRTIQLAKSERLFRVIAQNFPDGIISVLDEQLNILFVDGKELSYLGKKSEVLVGSDYFDGIPAYEVKNLKAQFNQVFKGETITVQLENKGRHYIIDAVPLTESNGAIELILVVEKNVTKFKKAEDEIKKSLKKERELNSMKSRFVSMASHEFRTPLGTILSSASLISRYKNSEQQDSREHHISKIKSSVSNLTSILNDFLSIDKLEAGKISVLLEKFDISNLCELIIEDMSGLLKGGQKIIYEHQGTEVNIILDKQLIGNSLLNLLSNASKYSHEDRVIYLTTLSQKDKLTITVKDYGIGIPEDEKKNLFKRFFRADNAINIQGTGLGLNITKKYVSLLNGKISFTSKENEGTSFVLEFPLKRMK